jgi:carboxypeptidase Q
LAIQYGARGCIFINNVEGRILLTGTASVDGKIIPIPAVCITQENGLSFRECSKFARHPWARIRMKNKSGKIKARNVVATLKGSELPDEEIILCGHLDSWDLAFGAIDNGIGSFTVLEIARVFEKLQIHPKRTIRFITFMGEEQGLLGSKAFVKERKAAGTLDKIKYVINLDMAGNTSGFNTSGRPEMEVFTKAVIEEIKKTDPEFKGSYASSAGLHSDHQTFLEQGIPIMEPEGSLDRSVYKYYHSNKDDFALVNPEHMSRCADFVGMMVYALANSKDLPAHRLTDTETRDFFIKAHLKDDLILGGEWRWEK